MHSSDAPPDLLKRVQARIDGQAYPPTHQYDIATLTPRGVLAERVTLILKLCPDFFQGRFFLDVGASKGFFSLTAAQHYSRVIAVDPAASVLALWALICPPNVRQYASSFAALGSGFDHLPYDMIWIGNGHHYLHAEDPLNWLRRVALLARDRVVIEGPVDASAKGFEQWARGSVPDEVTWLKQAQHLGLRLIGTTASPSYTPGRAIWFLRKTSS